MSFELIDSSKGTNKGKDNNYNFSNIEAEIALIGCLLLDNRNYEKISDFLSGSLNSSFS